VEEPEDWLRTSDTTSFLVPFLSSKCELRHDFQKHPAKFGFPSVGNHGSTNQQTPKKQEFSHGATGNQSPPGGFHGHLNGRHNSRWDTAECH
jgi:hypothetical protein